MSSSNSDDESHALRGPIDRGALIDFRDTFERAEPLADAAMDDFFDSNELRIELSDVENSCIDVSEIELVARATHKLWRNVYEQESFDGVNEVSNLP